MSEVSVKRVERDPSALPRRIRVARVISSRYPPGERPTSWDDRASGIDTVETNSGERLQLWGNGGQSSPAVGWELLLTRKSQNDSGAFEWTLYGIHKSDSAQALG